MFVGGGNKKLGIEVLIITSFVISFAIFVFSCKRKKNFFDKSFLLVQLSIPFTLLIFLTSKYNVQGEMRTLTITKRVSCIVIFILIWFFVLAVKELRKNWNKQFKLENAISFGTLVCIVNFNNYSGTGQIISSDLHHPFENIIGFFEMFKFGQKAFTEYIPVSGMYSILHGFFLWLFGDGYYAYYYVTENLFYFAVILFAIWMMRKQVRNYGIFFLAFLIPIMRYNRVALIIPILLILAWPRLIKNKNLWLKIWILTSLVNGLYYPVFGAAVCLGFLPMGIYQAISYGKSELRTDMKTRKFWIGWGISIIPVLLCIPFLLGTLKHMLAMSEQTMYADGIARFGQTVPDTFFSCIQSLGVRLIAYDTFTFLLQAAVVWVSAFLVIRIGGLKIQDKKFRWSNPEAAALSASIGIMMLVSFSYTLVRIDVNSIYARSEGVIYGAAVMIVLLMARYLKKKKIIYVMSGIVVFFVAVASENPVLDFNKESRLEPYYTVADDYVFVEDGRIPELGQCFVQQSVYNDIVSVHDRTRSLDENNGYIGIGNFGHFYLSSLKGDSVMESITIKGYDAVQETVDLMRKNGSVSTTVDSFGQYYFYHWLLTSGEYLWNSEDNMFYPNTEGVSVEEVQEKHKNLELAVENRELGRTPSSWGSARASLDEIFTSLPMKTSMTKKENSSIITFEKAVDGNDADFLYLEFEGMEQNYTYILFNHGGDEVQTNPSWFGKQLMKKDYNRGMTVNLSWKDDAGKQHSMSCGMGRGHLLIPLGSGSGWLFNHHDSVTIKINLGEEIVSVPNITKLELLKVREVK